MQPKISWVLMATTINEPHILASFSLPSRHRADRKGKGIAFDERPHVYAAQCGVLKLDEGEFVLAAQGDGIHVYEVRADVDFSLNVFPIIFHSSLTSIKWLRL